MPKLTETYAKKLPHSLEGTQKYWDNEIKGLVLFVGKRSKTWYYQKDVGGQTKRVLIGRYPVISSQAARQTAMELAQRDSSLNLPPRLSRPLQQQLLQQIMIMMRSEARIVIRENFTAKRPPPRQTRV